MQIWRFSEDKTKFDSVKITPVPLGHLKQNSFTFGPTEAYLVLVIHKTTQDDSKLDL